MYAGYDAPHTLFRVGRGFPCQRFSVSGRIRDTARIEEIYYNDVGVSGQNGLSRPAGIQSLHQEVSDTDSGLFVLVCAIFGSTFLAIGMGVPATSSGEAMTIMERLADDTF